MEYKKRKLIGFFGDVNFIDHNGGFVYRTVYGDYNMVYFQRREWLTSEENTPERWEVYESCLDPEYIDTDKLNGVYMYCGSDENELSLEQFKNMLNSDDPMERAFVFEQVAMYEGWSNFDWNYRLLTKTEINRQYGKWVQ